MTRFGAPGRPGPIGRRRVPRSVAVALAGLTGLLSVPGTAARQAVPPADGRWLVMPFDGPGLDPRVRWLGEAAAVLLTDGLTAFGATVVSRDERLAALGRIQVPPAASVSHATAVRAGRLLGVERLMVGSVALAGDRIEARARSIGLDAGSLETEFVESGPVGELYAIVDRLARRLMPQAGVPAEATLRLRPSLAAFEDYIKGLIAGSESNRIGYLQSALKREPAFDRARLALWAAYRDRGDAERALIALTAIPKSSPWYRQARFNAALTQVQLKRYDSAYATLNALAEQAPSAAVWNNLGVVQLRRAVTTPAVRPIEFFARAAAIDPDEPDYAFNLGYASWIDGDLPSAIRWLREAVRGNPADGDAHAALGAVLEAAGVTAEAAREQDLARQLAPGPAAWERRVAAGERAPRGLERLQPALDARPAGRAGRAVAPGTPPDQADPAELSLDRARELVGQAQDRQAETELRRVLRRQPYLAEAHLLLGRVLLRTGRVPEAIDAFRISLWSEETAAGHLALADAHLQVKDREAARGDVERALALAPDSAEARAALERLARQAPD